LPLSFQTVVVVYYNLCPVHTNLESKMPVVPPGSRPGTVKAVPVKLSFVLSAKNLPMRDRGPLGATVQDPLVKLLHKAKTSQKDWVEFGRTAHINNQPNPDWTEVFNYDWIEGQGQLWRFEVYDHDLVSKNDPMGYAEINVDYYVLSKFQELSYRLISEKAGANAGTLFVKQTIPVSFRLSADDIPHLDPLDGKSDPYVECYWSRGKNGPLTLFGVTHVIKNVETADWGRFEFANYQPGTNQWWTFKVYDKDPLPKDDVIGECQMEVDPFVNIRSTVIKQLSDDIKNKATLTIRPASIFYARP